MDFLDQHSFPPELEPDALLDLRLRVWAEIGRARMPAVEVVALGDGAIVDLDRSPDEAAEIYVNGMPYARGRLILVDGEWAVRIEEILPGAASVEHASSAGSGD